MASTVSGAAESRAFVLQSPSQARIAFEAPAGWGERLFRALLLLAWIGIASTCLLYGLDYYRLPLAARAAAPLHDLLKPSGLIGQGYGIVGTLFIIAGVGSYSIRKRIPWLRNLGTLHHWLQVHVFLCTIGPFLVLLHTTFRFGGIVSIAFWSMTAVAISGLFGRFVYAHIPRTIHGQSVTLDAVRAAQEDLQRRIREAWSGEADVLALLKRPRRAPPRSVLVALVLAMRYDLSRRFTLRRLRHRLDRSRLPANMQSELLTAVRAELAVEQQMLLLQPFQRLFHWWHVFHLPLTGVMFVVLTVHVAVAIMFGYTWIF